MAVEKNDELLTNEWVRNDWRESLFAPQCTIIQALTKGGATASGVSDDRKDALSKCLSETAEKSVLSAMEDEQADAETEYAFDSQDGIASHPDSSYARANAFLEAHERAAVSEWWLGLRAAKEVSEDWLRVHGFHNWLAKLRLGANIRRDTAVWLLDSSNDIAVIICKSQYTNSQDPILGFGASHCAFKAITKAVLENLLMEINLIEVLAARSGYSAQDKSRVEAKIANYANRVPALLGRAPAAMPNHRRSIDGLYNIIEETLPKAEFDDLTRPEFGQPVWKCHLLDQRDFNTSSIWSPFI